METKFNKVVLERILQLIELKGEIINKETILNFYPDKVIVYNISANRVALLKGIIKGDFSSFVGKEEKVELGIENIGKLRNFVKLFNNTEDIKLTKKENKLTLTACGSSESNLKASVGLMNPAYIKIEANEDIFTKLKEKSLGNTFTLDNELHIKKILEHFNSMNTNSVSFEGINNTIKLKVDDTQNKIESGFTVPEKVEKFNIKLNKLYLDLLSVINDNVTISMKDDSPIYTSVSNDNYSFEYIVAPIKTEG